MINHLIIITMIMPMFVGIINILIKQRMLSYYLTCVTTAITFLVSVSILLYTTKNSTIRYSFGGWLPPIGIEFKVSLLNALFLNIISGAAFLTCLYGKKIISTEIQKEKITSFCSVFLMCVAGLNGIILTNDFFNLYVFIELSALSSYALISIGYNRAALKAAFFMALSKKYVGRFVVLRKS